MERAVRLDERYLTQKPDDRRVLSNCSIKKATIGILYLNTFHDYAAAEVVARTQLAAAEGQLKRSPDDAKWLTEERHNRITLAAVLQRQCRFAEAETLARQSCETTARAVAADPGNVMLVREQGVALSTLGQVLLGAGKAADAKVVFLEWVAVIESSKADLVAVDLVPACDGVLHAALRAGDFAAADRAVEKALQALKRRPNLTPEQLRTFDTTLGALRTACQAFPESLTSAEPIANLPDESAAHAVLIRITHLARAGEAGQADREVQQARKRFPNHPVCWKARACVDGVAAERTTDAAERRRHTASGVTALLRAIELDPSILETMHLAPEWNALRTDETFRRKLAAFLLKRYPVDPPPAEPAQRP
jgi:tetratricopeptide (TPR) repeat protein